MTISVCMAIVFHLSNHRGVVKASRFASRIYSWDRSFTMFEARMHCMISI